MSENSSNLKISDFLFLQPWSILAITNFSVSVIKETDTNNKVGKKDIRKMSQYSSNKSLASSFSAFDLVLDLFQSNPCFSIFFVFLIGTYS